MDASWICLMCSQWCGKRSGTNFEQLGLIFQRAMPSSCSLCHHSVKVDGSKVRTEHHVAEQVASALMKHAVDKEFEENAPVPENIADLAKAAEEEMKIDAEVMES